VSTSDKPARRGRPSTYTPELGREICARLTDGEATRAIAVAAGHLEETGAAANALGDTI